MQPQCNCSIDYYILPNIDLIAGDTRDINFHCYFHRNKEALDMTGCTAKFSITDFVHKTSRPKVTKVMDLRFGNIAGGTNVKNIFHVQLVRDDTIDLYGKYIYQITVKGPDGRTDIPDQGTMYIKRNIDKAAAN